jgi:hypothetical protein
LSSTHEVTVLLQAAPGADVIRLDDALQALAELMRGARGV